MGSSRDIAGLGQCRIARSLSGLSLRLHKIGRWLVESGSRHRGGIGRNLFLDAQGRWTGRYLPIVLRTWPFRLVQQPDSEGSRLIAAHLPALSSGSGEPLFDAKGDEAPWLMQVMKDLVVLDQSAQSVHTHVKALEDAGLLQSRNLQFMLPDGRQLDLGGFHVVDEQLLEALPVEKAGALHAQGVLAMAYLHLLSMRQFRPLLERAALASAPVATADATA